VKRLTRDKIIYQFDKNLSPVLEVEPRESILLETLDARSGSIKEDAYIPSTDMKRVNPATGPIWVKGAKPGNTLIVKIEDIKVSKSGWIAAKTDTGVLKDKVKRSRAKIVEIRENQIKFSEKIIFPVKPMVGTIGTAPAGKAISTAFPGDHGGNMDNNDIAVNSKVYLPVNVEGALFALGDVHARMGDGELSGTGVEVCAEVKIKIDLIKGQNIKRPYIETPYYLISTGYSSNLKDAIRMATQEMAGMLVRKMEIDIEEALMIISAAGDLRICQACDSAIDVTVCLRFPKLILGLQG